MKETLLIGDFLFVNKMAYGYSRHSCPFSLCPFSGRILGLRTRTRRCRGVPPSRQRVDFIKRLIGLPGDTVQMQRGAGLNGAEVPQTPDGTFSETYDRQGPMGQLPRCENAPVGQGGICTKSRAIETLPGGRTHTVLNIDTGGFADNTPCSPCPPGITSSWATTATTARTAAMAAPWAAWALCRRKT
jgi:signal peptidase I